MSNPLINRWGLNLFWYNFWFTDKNNQFFIHQDSLITSLISIYTQYGLITFKSIFINNYWYNNFNIIRQNYINNHNLTYFRSMEFKNRLLNEINFITIRNKIKNIYKSKIWILRYQKWLIINFYCFQPFTKKQALLKSQYKKTDSYLPQNTLTNKTQIKYKSLIRYNYLLKFIFNNLINKNKYYFF